MEKIEIGYSSIAISGNQAHHKFLLYTRSDGSTYQIHGEGSRNYGSSPVEELVSSGPHDLAGFGHLSVKIFKSSKKLHVDALNKPREIVFEGDNLTRMFFKMAGMAQGIAEQKTKYNALSNNSNTLVDRVVQWSGGKAPQLGQRYMSPGSIEESEFKPEFFSKMPPVMWGKETYDKHRDVVDDLFFTKPSIDKAKQPLGKQSHAEVRAGQGDKQTSGNPLDGLPDDLQDIASRFYAPHRNADVLTPPSGQGIDYPLSDKQLMPGANRILSPAFELKRRHKESRISPAQSISNQSTESIAEPSVDTRIPGNPFDLEKTDLKRQARLIQDNPVRAKQLIQKAGRDPRLFGFA